MRLVKQLVTGTRFALGIYGTEKEITGFTISLYCAAIIPDYTSRYHEWPYLHLGAPDSFGYVLADAVDLGALGVRIEDIPEERFLAIARGEPYAMTAEQCRKAKAEIRELALLPC